MAKRRFKTAVVEWNDSYSQNTGWAQAAEYAHQDNMLIHSVGILLKRSKQGVTLVQSMDEQGKVNDSIFIPAKAIRRVRLLYTTGKR